MQSEVNHAALPRFSAEFAREIKSTVVGYYTDNRVAQITAKQRLAYRYYYDLNLSWSGWGDGPNGSTSAVTRGGDEGERAVVRINHWRSLVRNQVAMITNAKFLRKPRASSYDYESMEAVKRAKHALEHYWNNEGDELLRIERVESASMLGEGFTHRKWDPQAGSEVTQDPRTGVIVRSGNIVARDVLPMNVIRDPSLPWEQQRSIVVRFPKESRWDLLARYPKHEQAILMANSPLPMMAPTEWGATMQSRRDDVEVWYFYHLPCAALPRGRESVILCDGETVLEDHDLEWGEFPIVRVVESNVKGMAFGYPSSWETLGIQELYDALQTCVATNQTTFGTQYVRVKPGVDPKPIQLGGGLAVIVGEKDDIEPMQLTASPPEIFGHMQSLRQEMQLLSGQSGVNRGEAAGDRQSGAALAVLSAETIKNASPYQTSDTVALKTESRITLKMLRRKATWPMKIGVQTSKGMPSRQMNFKGDMLGDTTDVDIELANPLEQTAEGRIALLQTLAQLKVPVTLDQAIEMITTGRSEPVTDPVTEQGLNILRENEQLSQAEVPRALITDDHLRHCREHLIVLSNPSARDQPNIIEAVVAHVHEHYSLAYGVPNKPMLDPMTGMPVNPILADPMYRARMMELAGVPMPQLQTPPQGAMPMPGEPQPQPGGAPAPAGGSPPAPPKPPGNPAAGNPNAAAQMPTNKATGRPYDPQTGGGTPQSVVA